jgi:hypothetical protein
MTTEDNITNLALGGSGGHGDGNGEENGNNGDGGSDDTFPLLDRLLEELPEILERFVLPALDPADLAMLARTARLWRAAVVSSNLPRAGSTAGPRLKLKTFCVSVQRLAWANANGCPWNVITCAYIAGLGQVEVLQWAREHSCPWNPNTCAFAAEGGHLVLLRWARDQGCPWNTWTCANAAGGGHLDVLKWAHEHGCPWNEDTCNYAAWGGHLDLLK